MDYKKMSLREKVGQMLMFAFHGTEFNDQLKTQIRELHLGGVAHFARNIENATQARRLNKAIQDYAKIPLFIGLDQEGGSVLRVMRDIVPLPGAMALSASLTNPYEICKFVGEDLRCLGFNMNFAPVGDVNNNPRNPVINSRSYSDHPEEVAKYAIGAFRGFQAAGIIPTIKHFPGHGNTSVDSHIGLPVVFDTKEELYQLELVPFKKAIDAGIDGVMIAHILFSSYDPVFPSSMSKAIVTDLLKEELGFRGLIVTDSLTMGAISKKYSKEEVVLHAANAGIDVMIFCGKAEINEQREICETFVRLVEEGQIPMSRIDESVQKILAYKEQYAIQKLTELDVLDVVGKKEATNYAKTLQQNSITIVKDGGILPIKKQDRVLFITSKLKLFSLVDNENQNYRTMNEYLGYEEIIIDEKTFDFTVLQRKITEFDKIIFATYNVQEGDYQTKVYQMLDPDKTIVISMRSPYDLHYLPNVKTYICIYEATPLAFECVSRSLINPDLAIGVLPVTIGNERKESKSYESNQSAQLSGNEHGSS